MAYALGKVISFFHIFLKSLSLSYKSSLKVGKMESRCTVIGISVAESCGIQETWPDSYSMLLSSRLPARPQLRPSVWVTPYAQIYSVCDRLYGCRQGNCLTKKIKVTAAMRHNTKDSQSSLTILYHTMICCVY